MFLFGSRGRSSHRLRALYEVYANFLGENSPEARGRRLLCQWLSPRQLEQFKLYQHFDVVGSHTGRIYRISYGAAANVHVLDAKGEPLCCYCFVPNARLVPGDIMLAQKIALETDENSALALANRFPPRATCF
nr:MULTISPECIES: hypothetical protein [Bradyrhizobium]